jgi:hypothetical protein
MQRLLTGLLVLILFTVGQAHASSCLIAALENTPTSRFTDNIDGTVTDASTGLTWKRCSEGQTWNRTSCTGEPSAYRGSRAALQMAESLNKMGGYAGQDDWRVPNFKELNSIVERKCASPSINETVFPNTPYLTGFWSASPALTNPGHRWIVDFESGDSHIYGDFYYQGYVRLVRAGQDESRFELNLEGVVKTTDGLDVCAMVLASGKFMFSCNPAGLFSLPDLPSESDGTVKRQIYADGFFPKVDVLVGGSNDAVVLTRSGTCPNYNTPINPNVYPNISGKRIDISGSVNVGNNGDPVCAMVLANGKHMFSCDGSGGYALNIPLDKNGQFKLQVYADGFAPTVQTFDEFQTRSDVRMARSSECTETSSPSQSLPDSFIAVFNDYSARAEKKAIALALDSDGRSTWAYGFGYSSQDQANDGALSACRNELSKTPVNADCRLYAIGESVVW